VLQRSAIGVINDGQVISRLLPSVSCLEGAALHRLRSVYACWRASAQTSSERCRMLPRERRPSSQRAVGSADCLNGHGPLIICEATGLPWRAKTFAPDGEAVVTRAGRGRVGRHAPPPAHGR
jgi:hypothetical protein